MTIGIRSANERYRVIWFELDEHHGTVLVRVVKKFQKSSLSARVKEFDTLFEVNRYVGVIEVRQSIVTVALARDALVALARFSVAFFTAFTGLLVVAAMFALLAYRQFFLRESKFLSASRFLRAGRN